MGKGKFKKSPFGKMVIGFGKGILKEAVSNIPIVGDNMANFVENKIGTGVTIKDPALERGSEYIGKAVPWIIGAALIYFEVITFDQLARLLGIAGTPEVPAE